MSRDKRMGQNLNLWRDLGEMSWIHQWAKNYSDGRLHDVSLQLSTQPIVPVHLTNVN